MSRSPSRRYVLGGLLVVLTVTAAALLADVLGTVFFAVTVAYLLVPVRRRLAARGLPRRWACFAATLLAFAFTLAVLAPLVAIFALRFQSLLALLSTIPRELSVTFFGFTYHATLAEMLASTTTVVRGLAGTVLAMLPSLLIKLTLFALLVFSLLYHDETAREAALAVVPPNYRDVAAALGRRTRETLFAIYVLQAATALGTFVAGLVVFVALGYRFFFALATIAAILQFIPILGPSLLVVALAAYQFVIGDFVAGTLMLLLGGAVIAWLPDVLIRPRLAQQTAGLPGGLYFVGFVGGLLTLGAVGVIAGPLVVALVVEVATLLSAELNDETATGSNGDAAFEPEDAS